MKKNEDLMLRTKKFALRIIRLYSKLPKSTVAQVIGKQILRCYGFKFIIAIDSHITPCNLMPDGPGDRVHHTQGIHEATKFNPKGITRQKPISAYG